MSDDHVTLPDDEPDQPTEVQPPIGSDGTEEPTQAAPEPVVPVCAGCGALLDEDQPYCLQCGAPTSVAPTLRRRLRPAAILALGLAALGIGAGTLAYAIANDDEPTATVQTGITTTPTTLPTFPTTIPTDSSTGLPPFPSTITPTVTPPPTFPTSTDTTTIPPTTGPTTTPSTVTTTPSTVTTTPSTVTTTPSTVTTTPPPTTSPSTGADTWPDGTSGWTVIVASTSSQSDATALRDRLRNSGLSAGLLDTSQYSTLEPGLWAVYIGVYTSRDQAISQASTVRETSPGAYAARIVEG